MCNFEYHYKLKKMRLFFVTILFALGFSSPLLADSPLTSTLFHLAYKHIPEVDYAINKGLDKKVFAYLSSDAPSDHKLAVLNGLSWGDTTLVHTFESFLLKKRKGLKAEVFDFLRSQPESDSPEETDQSRKLTTDDLMCWSYLQAMGNYFQPMKALRGAFYAYNRDTGNMAYGVNMGLIGSQIVFDVDWCSVYTIAHELIEVQTYSTCIFSEQAVSEIMNYLNLYQESCVESEE